MAEQIMVTLTRPAESYMLYIQSVLHRLY